MFRRTEESEWSRFSRALTGRDEKEGAEAPVEGASTPETAEATLTAEPGSPAAVFSPTARPPTADSNLTVSRATTPGPRPSFNAEEVESVIGQHSSFDGTYRSESSIRVLGNAQGEIECQKAVFVDENAKVDAKITAESVTVAGEVHGEINCTGRVELRPSGRVIGTINAATLIMQEGAFFDGNLHMRQGPAEGTTIAS